MEENSFSLLTLHCWMKYLPEDVRSKPIFNLSIPGSHDSGSFDLKDDCLANDLHVVSRLCLRLCSSKFIKGCAKTQHLSIVNQLKVGVRYFDFRVIQKNPNEGRTDRLFLFCHALYGPNIYQMCSQINDFLHDNPSEIVIIDFQHFYQMQLLDHFELIHLCIDAFGKRLCSSIFQSNVEHITLKALQANGRQVICIYRCQEALDHYNIVLLWSGRFISNPFFNTHSTVCLKTKLTQTLEKRTDFTKFLVLQAIFTVSVRKIFHLYNNSLLEQMATECNQMLKDWLEQANSFKNSPNIVMFDFVEMFNYNLIRKVIELNLKNHLKNKQRNLQ